MNFKNLPTLLFILAFAGATLLGYSQVIAANGIDLGDGICSDLEKKLNLCIRDECYVIEALLCDDGRTWPCRDTIDGVSYNIFRYRARIAADVTLPCDCDTWSYTVTQFQICEGANSVDYIAGSYPPGASSFISNCKVSKCSDATAPNDWGICNVDYQVWKLNPTLNCSDGGFIDFEIHTPLDAGISCGNPTWIRDKSGCTAGDNLLRGPGCDDVFIDITSVALGGFATDIDPCTGEAVNPFIDGEPATEVKTWFCENAAGEECNPKDPQQYCDCRLLTTTGPTSGCVFKSNPTRGCIGSRCFR